MPHFSANNLDEEQNYLEFEVVDMGESNESCSAILPLTPKKDLAIKNDGYVTVFFNDPDYNVVKWQNGAQTRLEFYIDPHLHQELPNCNFVVDILKKAMLWNENTFNATTEAEKLVFRAGYKPQAKHIGTNYDVNWLPIKILTADPSNSKEEDLYSVIDFVIRSVLVSDQQESDDIDFVGIIKHHLFMVDELGPMFEIYYAKKNREALSANRLSLVQKCVSLALALEALWGRDKLIAAIEWHLASSPLQFGFLDVVNSFNKYHKDEFGAELPLLKEYDLKAPMPTLIISTQLQQHTYIISTRFLQNPKHLHTVFNPVVIKFRLVDKNGKQLSPIMSRIISQQSEAIKLEINQDIINLPILALDIKTLAAHVIENEAIDAGKLIAFEGNDPVAKYFAWQSMLRFYIVKMLLQYKRNGQLEVPKDFLQYYQKLLTAKLHLGVKALLLKLPLHVSDVKRYRFEYSADAIKSVLLHLNNVVAQEFAANFKELYDLHSVSPVKNLDFSKPINSQRALQNVCFVMLLQVNDLQALKLCRSLALPDNDVAYTANMEIIASMLKFLQVVGYPEELQATLVLNNFFEKHVKISAGGTAVQILLMLFALDNVQDLAKNLILMRELKYPDGSLFFDIKSKENVASFSEKLLRTIIKSDITAHPFWHEYIAELQNNGHAELADRFIKLLKPVEKKSELLAFSKKFALTLRTQEYIVDAIKVDREGYQQVAAKYSCISG